MPAHASIQTSASPGFLLETMVDFPDDVLESHRTLTVRDIDSLMSKLADVAMQRMRIEAAEISLESKRFILQENAVKFFKLTCFHSAGVISAME